MKQNAHPGCLTARGQSPELSRTCWKLLGFLIVSQECPPGGHRDSGKPVSKINFRKALGDRRLNGLGRNGALPPRELRCVGGSGLRALGARSCALGPRPAMAPRAPRGRAAPAARCAGPEDAAPTRGGHEGWGRLTLGDSGPRDGRAVCAPWSYQNAARRPPRSRKDAEPGTWSRTGGEGRLDGGEGGREGRRQEGEPPGWCSEATPRQSKA